MLVINNLSVSIGSCTILKELSLKIEPGTVHALMGPNGSGKSTLAQTIIGNPSYKVCKGSIHFNGKAIIHLSPHERAKRSIFLTFQQPPAIPGLKVRTFLQEMRIASGKKDYAPDRFMQEIKEYCVLLQIDTSFLERSCNDGFSGGEKKRFELLQVLVAQPQLIILDEIDSGLDIDALQLVADVLKKLQAINAQMTILIITHYQRLLDYIIPDQVHLLAHGTITYSGTASIVAELEQKGYDGYLKSN